MDNASLDLASREILTLITPGYRPPPTYSSWLSWLPGMPPFTMTAVDAMRRDYQVKLAMAMKVVPVMKPQFGISGDPQVVEFVESELRSIWTSCITDITEAMWYTRFGCEMVYKRADDGMVRFCRMMPFHPRDFHILTRQGEITGLKVIASNNTAEMDTSDPAAYQQGVTACENDKAIIFAPKSFVYVHNRKFGSYEGCSELEGAFQPWMEKVREGGAISSRSLWFYKCAFDSGIIKHPPGMYVSEASGVQVPYRDIALKVGESVRNGATIALESTYDASGHPAWDYVRAQANQGGDIILQLIDHLDGKINKGAGIPDDVIEQVSGTGSYAGRTIPFIAFLEAGTPTVRSISKELVRQVLMPLAQINFGESRGKDWEITEAGVNTAEFLDDGSGTVQGDGDGDGIPNEDMIPDGEDNSGRGVPQQSGAQSQGVQQMSLSGEDRQKLNKFRRQFSSKSVSFVREGRATGRTQVQVQFSVADEPFSLKREKSKKFVPKNSSSQQTDLFGETKLTHSPADAFVKKQAESLDGQKDLFSQKQKPESAPAPQEHSAKPQSASPQKSEGRWITIGGHGEDGGGVHVCIGKDGRIQKGPAGIVDKKISELSDDKGGEGRKSPKKSSATDNKPHQFRSDDEYAKEAVDSAKEDFAKMAGKESGNQLSAKDSKKFAQQKYITAHQNAQDEARIHGISTHDVLQVMPQAYEFRMEQWKATEPARQYAMKATGMTDFKAGGIENKYRDHSTVPEFDERSRSVAVAHPELGLDPQGHDTPAKIWDLIRSGGSKKPKMEDRETAYIAADWIAQAKLQHKGLANSDNGDPDEDTSFDFGANVLGDQIGEGESQFVEFSHFDPVAHPRDESGQFIISAMRSIEPGADRGALVTARDLRKHFGTSISKQELDAAMLALAKSGKISLHHHDYPASLKPEDLDQLISYPVDANHRFGYKGNAYVVGANIRQNQ